TPAEAWAPTSARPLPASSLLGGRGVDHLQLHHCREGALCLRSACGEGVGEGARSDLPGKAPAVFAPTTLAFLTAVADDRVPVAVRFLLIVGGDLERERLALLEVRAAVETDTRDAENGELHRQHVAFLAA